MNDLTAEEVKIIEKWRQLPSWGTLEVEKNHGVLFEIRLHTKERPENKPLDKRG
jgi:hypothetical protein